MEYRIEIDGENYEMSELYSVTITQPLFEQFSVGNACSAKLEITLAPHGVIPKMAKIVPYARKTSADEWSMLGVFYIDTRALNSGLLEITAYDDMLKAETVWEPDQSLVFPMTMPDCVGEISRLMGVTVDPRTALSSQYTVDYPTDDYTLREVLRYIGAAHGGNWIMTSKGELLLVPLFDSIPVETSYLVTESGYPITFGGERILI